MKNTRPLGQKEIDIINETEARIKKRLLRVFKFMLISILIGIALGLCFFLKLGNIYRTDLFLISSIYLTICIWVGLEQYFRLNAKLKSLNFLKMKSIVTSVKVVSDKYYLLDESDDEGVYYLFQLSDNTVFSFGGQEFYPSENFPSDNFEIVEGRGLKGEILLLELYNYGNKIEPAKIFKGNGNKVLLEKLAYPDPEKLTVITGTIEDVIARCHEIA